MIANNILIVNPTTHQINTSGKDEDDPDSRAEQPKSARATSKRNKRPTTKAIESKEQEPKKRARQTQAAGKPKDRAKPEEVLKFDETAGGQVPSGKKQGGKKKPRSR